MNGWRGWLHGLVAAVIIGATNSVAVVVVDPHTFDDWPKLAKMAAVFALVGGAAYLKQSPLPRR